MPEDRFPRGKRYFVQTGHLPWVEVDLIDWCAAERNAGFHPKPGCGPAATAGFGTSGVNGERRGRIVDKHTLAYMEEHPEFVDDDWLAILPMLDRPPT